MSLETAERLFGIDAKSLQALPTPISGTEGLTYRYPFKSVTFSGENESGVTVNNPDILLVPNALSHAPGVTIIGMGILRQLHLYIAYREHKLYVSQAAVTPLAATWIADPGTGCKVWNPNPELNETITWTGSCQNGIATGNGTLQWFEGGMAGPRYDGNLEKGRMSGNGVYTWKGGSSYDGQWVDGNMDGHGVFKSIDGSRYDGQWADDRISGHGIYTWPNGTRYDGEFANSLPNGPGTYTLSNGTTYSGNWTNGCSRQGNEIVRVTGVSKAQCNAPSN
jgi:hypothetical protein